MFESVWNKAQWIETHHKFVEQPRNNLSKLKLKRIIAVIGVCN